MPRDAYQIHQPLGRTGQRSFPEPQELEKEVGQAKEDGTNATNC